MSQGAEQAAVRLASIISRSHDIAVACSGGIDSLVLSAAVHSTALLQGLSYALFHAVSAAVPGGATERVVKCARDFSWNLRLIEAKEFNDNNYRSNPADRCFYCKSALYGTIAGLTPAQIFSGTNLDDLNDYRPGLGAACKFGVLHPFVMADIDKKMVRALAVFYGLEEYKDLPASPCLASRVETGISIEQDELESIDRIEHLIASRYAARTVRCRLRARAVVIELDESQLGDFAHELGSNPALEAEIRSLLAGRFCTYPIACAGYARGSATVQVSK
jgi:pyridinium-3,5-biscarboxylic acid mononucleotide sulfurtransferase